VTHTGGDELVIHFLGGSLGPMVLGPSVEFPSAKSILQPVMTTRSVRAFSGVALLLLALIGGSHVVDAASRKLQQGGAYQSQYAPFRTLQMTIFCC
jgi:hypothetical protein